MKRTMSAPKPKPRNWDKAPTAKHNLVGKVTPKPYKEAAPEPKK